MPWKVKSVMNVRMEFVLRVQNGERVTDLCREYEISRTTGYKFIERFKKYGAKGLFDESKKPIRLARQTPLEIQKLILDQKRDKPTWGAAKIKEILERKYPELAIPVRSTIHDLLDRHGYVKSRGKRRMKAYPTPLTHVTEPNQLWCTDFKGQFRLLNQKYCYPFTLSDYHSRYLLGCEGLESIDQYRVKNIFEIIFKEHGLPDAIRSDNGVPFSTRTVYGLSKLSVWWMRLGIAVERIAPGCPEQNGRHERMHRTLKAETTQPPGKNLLQQQEKFDLFKEDYNNVRPHEALNMKVPSEIYKPSQKFLPKILPEPDYPLHDFTRRVSECGSLTFKNQPKIFISEVLGGQMVGIREEEEGLWRLTFMDQDLGFIDQKTKRFLPRQVFEHPQTP